jgi:hypothetical protein
MSNGPPTWDNVTETTTALDSDFFLGIQTVDGAPTFVRIPRSLAGVGGGSSGLAVPTVVAAEPIAAGQPIVIGSDGLARRARADDSMRSAVAGLASATVASGFATSPLIGLVTLADWSAVIGTTDLTAGSVYWLASGGPGLLTTTAATAAGLACVRIGIAISHRTLSVELSSIQL